MKRFIARHPFVLVPFLFYGLTASRTIGMSDTAILIFDIQNLDLSAGANSHNLTLLLGKLCSFIPVGSLAVRGNMMSVFSGGLAVALFYFLVRRCTGSRLVAAMTASILMVSHSMWWHSTITEAYAVNACLVIGALYLLDRHRVSGAERDILGLLGLAGLALFQHAQLGVIGLGALVVTASHVARLLRRPTGEPSAAGFLARAALVSAVGLAPYMLVLAHDALEAGSFFAAFGAAAGGDFRGIMFDWAAGLGVADTVVLTIVQFPSPFLLVVGIGLLVFVERWKATASTVAVLTMFAVNTVFFTLYHTWDRFAFLLVSFVIVAFWGGFAVEAIVAWAGRRSRPRRVAVALGFGLCVLMPPLVYPNLAAWRARPGSVWAMRFNQDAPPHTLDPVAYNANPDKHGYTDIAEFSDLLFSRLPANAVYVTDDAFFFTLQYYAIYESRRPDLAINFVNSWGFAGFGLSPTELVDLLDYARAAGLPLFLERLDAPFDAIVSGKDYAFERFPLDERRWVHRLIGARAGRGAAFVPTVRRTVVGYGRGGPGAAIATHVRADEELTVLFEFEKNSSPFPVTYRWIAPGEQPRFSSPVFIVPRGSGSAGWVQDRHGVLTPGEWRVEVWVGATRVDSTGFAVL